LYTDWKAHGIQAIEEVRERRPADYLRIVAMIVLKCEDYTNGLSAGIRNEAIAELIEERRRLALAAIERMKN
jgi:hypothetical protein